MTPAVSEQTVARVARLNHDPLVSHLQDLTFNRGDARIRAREARQFFHSMKDASAGATSEVGNWGAALAVPGLASFINQIRERSVLGRLVGVNYVPPATPVAWPGTGASAAFVGGARPKIVASFGLSAGQLIPWPLGIITAMSRDLIRLNTAVAQTAVRNHLLNAIARGLDVAFTDLAQTGAVGEYPAAITASAPSFPASGTDEAAALADLHQLMATAVAAGATPGAGVSIVASLANSLVIANAIGRAAPLLGNRLRIVVADAAEDRVILIVPSMLLAAGGDNAIFDVSENAALEMDDAPSGGAQSLVSLFQANAVGIRAEIFINWTALDGAVAYISGAAYGNPPLS